MQVQEKSFYSTFPIAFIHTQRHAHKPALRLLHTRSTISVSSEWDLQWGTMLSVLPLECTSEATLRCGSTPLNVPPPQAYVCYGRTGRSAAISWKQKATALDASLNLSASRNRCSSWERERKQSCVKPLMAAFCCLMTLRPKAPPLASVWQQWWRKNCFSAALV